MSGRDYKKFVTNHRADDKDTLVRRAKSGVARTKYKHVDYDQLKAYTAEKKFVAQESMVKLKKFEHVSKHSKDQNMIKQHKMTWHKEFSRLNSLRKRLQAESEALVRQNTCEEECEEIFDVIEDYESSLAREFGKFKTATVDPIWSLREDLQYWLAQHQNEPQDNSGDVASMVQSVREQQRQVMERLHNEQISLEQELQTGHLPGLVHPEKTIQQGIPEEAFDIYCPDDELKTSLLQEFILLDEKYRTRLEKLEADHQSAISLHNGGWNEEDHFVYQYVVDQYPHDMPHRRMLYLERLKRHLKHKSRAQFVEHEEWMLSYKYYQERRKVLFNDWTRDRHELLNKMKAVSAELIMMQELEEAKAEHRHRQEELCGALYDKVQQWREQKAEAMMLEQKLEEEQRRLLEEREKQQEEKDLIKRQEQRKNIQVYQEKKDAQLREEQERDRRRLEELHHLLAEQAKIDKERVQYREAELSEKRKEKQRQEAEKKEEEVERERVLEALREKVRPVVESDPERVQRETEAWQAHKTEDENINIQKPLFDLHSFTAQQVASDPRVRLEQKLREAGIHNTNYARHALAQMKPLQPPRRDMESTVFKQQ